MLVVPPHLLSLQSVNLLSLHDCGGLLTCRGSWAGCGVVTSCKVAASLLNQVLSLRVQPFAQQGFLLLLCRHATAIWNLTDTLNTEG